MNTDALIERMKLKSQVRRWRVLFILVLLLAFVALANGTGALPGVSRDYIARISVEGIIDEDLYRDDVIRNLSDDPHVKAVIVYVNSPGGTAAGGEALYESIKYLSARRPTVAVMGNLATSAGYLASIGASRIFAQNATITGSIGVIFQSPNVKKFAENIGVELQEIKTDPLKGEPSLVEPLSLEARDMILKVMRDFHDVFIQQVSERRSIPIEKAKSLSNGRVFSGKEALEKGLIDAIGTYHDAVSWLRQEYGIAREVDIIETDLTEPEPPFDRFMSGAVSSLLGEIKLLIANSFFESGLLSRWNNGAIIYP